MEGYFGTNDLAALLGRMFGTHASSMLASAGVMPDVPLPQPRPPEAGPGKDTSQVPGLPSTAPMSGFLDQGPPLSGMGSADEAGAALAGPGGPAGFVPQGPELPGNYGGSPADNPNLAPIGAAPAPPQSGADKLLGALRGVTVPKPPEPQRVSTPANPGRPAATAPQNNIMQLLQMMMAGQQQPPMSLGQALSGRG